MTMLTECNGSTVLAFAGHTAIQRGSLTVLGIPSARVATRPAYTACSSCFARRRPDMEPDQNEELPLEAAIDRISGIISSSTPLIPQVALGYPLVLLLLGLVLPFFTWILSCGLFVGFFYLGCVIIDEDDNKPRDILALLSLAGGLASAGLVSPAGLLSATRAGGDVLMQVVGFSMIALAAASLVPFGGDSTLAERDSRIEEPTATSLDDELLQRWDKKFVSDESEKDEEL